MGIHNELRHAQALRRAYLTTLGVKDPDVVVERLGETLTPTIDIWSLPEWAFPRDEQLVTCAAEISAGGAGTLASVALYNDPARAPDFLLVVEIFDVYVVAAANVVGYLSGFPTTPGIATPISTRVFADRRARPESVSNGNEAVGQVLTGIPVGVPAGFIVADRVKVPANDNRPFRAMVPAVIPPGHFIAAANSDDAAVLGFALRWRERRALPGEL